MTSTSADWCEDFGSLAICGTRMVEDSRRTFGERWCFHCRERHEFWDVLMVPDGPSWYDPYRTVEGVTDGCCDLFPGWSRTWEDA